MHNNAILTMERRRSLRRFSTTSNSQVVVFDFGGVIFDWNPYYLYRHFFDNDKQAVELFLEEIHFTDWNFQLDLGYPFKKMIAEVSGKFPQYSDPIRAYDERWIETFGGPITSTVDVLKKLHSQGHPLYALSNWSREKFALVRPKFEFLDYFERIFISGEEKVGKPDERIFKAFIEKTDLQASRCLFIDDSRENIRVAANLGFDTIHFRDADQLSEELIIRKLL